MHTYCKYRLRNGECHSYSREFSEASHFCLMGTTYYVLFDPAHSSSLAGKLRINNSITLSTTPLIKTTL